MIVATSGSIAGWNIHSDRINKGNVEINSTDEFIGLGATTLTGNGIFLSGSGEALIGNYAGDHLL